MSEIHCIDPRLTQMRTLEELIDTSDPGFPIVQQWIADAARPVEALPPSPNRADVLLRTQVTTRSLMGAIVYETGGLLIDHGWLRILGSGNERLTRTLPDWNANSNGLYLVADDAVGGLFALNGGSLGPDVGTVHYYGQDSLEWQSLKCGYSDFVCWACTGDLGGFYEWIRWPGWERDVSTLHGDRCYFFYPFLSTVEGHGGVGKRGEVPIAEILP